jgi:hypothetical protein
VLFARAGTLLAPMLTAVLLVMVSALAVYLCFKALNVVQPWYESLKVRWVC